MSSRGIAAARFLAVACLLGAGCGPGAPERWSDPALAGALSACVAAPGELVFAGQADLQGSPGEPCPPPGISLARLVRAAQARQGRRGDAAETRLLALAALAAGESRGAVRLFEGTVALAPVDPTARNDLAAARGRLAAQPGEAWQWVLAFEDVETALGSASPPPEALCNRALLLERFGLRRTAASERARLRAQPAAARACPPAAVVGAAPPPLLSDFLASPPDRSRLRAQLHDFRATLREWGEEELWTAWADARAAGDAARAGRLLALGAVLGELQAADVGDRLLDGLAREAAGAGSDPALLDAWRSHAAGLREIRVWEARRAAAFFARAAAAFASRSSRAAALAHLRLASCRYLLGDLDGVARTLALIDTQALVASPSLAGRWHWLQSMASAQSQRPLLALEHAQRAQALFERAGEAPSVLSMATSAAFALADLGRRQSGRETLAASLAGGGAGGGGEKPEREHLRLGSIATFLADAAPALARAFFEEALRIEEGDDQSRALILLRLSELERAAGRREAEDRRLAEAAAAARAVREPQARAFALYAAELGRLARLRASDPAGAARELERLGASPWPSPWLEGARRWETYLALRSAGRGDEARRAALAAADWGLAAPAEALPAGLGRSYRGLRRDILDAALAESLAAGVSGAELLDLLERYRGSASGRRRAVVAPLRAGLEEGALVLVYWLLPERGLLWVVSKEAADLRVLEAPRDEVRSWAAAWSDLDGRPDAESSRRLAAFLLDGAEPGLARARRLVIVRDPLLAGVPFAALPGSGGEPLLRSLAIAYAPSLRGLRPASARARPAPVSVAVVADPDLPPAASLFFARLPGAREEARRIAPHYPRAALLAGAAATEAAVEAAGRGADVLHVGAHARNLAERPGESWVQLTAADGDDGRWTAAEVAALRSVARVVVLAACETALHEQATLEDAGALPAAFLDAGAEAVIASRLPVEDREVVALLERLHAGLAAALRPAEALRRAQLAFIDVLPARDWASFEVTVRTLD